MALPLAAAVPVGENSHQGFSSKKINTHPGWSEVNLKTATGIGVSLRREGIRSRCQSLNRYAYVMNNPTALIDPLGLDSCKPGTPNCKQPPPCYGMVCADNPATYGGLPYPGYQNIAAPDLFDLQLFTVCNSEGCGTGLDFNGATVANGLLLAQGSNQSNNSTFTIGIKAPGQTFKPCMQQHADTYSIGGATELTINVVTGTNTSVSSSTLASAVTGNNINTLFFGSTAGAAASMAANAPSLVSTAMGSPLSFGRRTADIMSLNLWGIRGGPPLALSSAAGGVKSFLGSMGRALSLGMDFTTKLGVDTALTGAEAIGCSMTMSF